jgi:type IV secretion system protein VirD4
MDPEVRRALVWRITCLLATAGLLVAVLPLALPLTYLAERGISRDSIDWVVGYGDTLVSHGDYWVAVHRRWLGQALAARRLPAAILLLPMLAFAVGGAGLAINPYSGVAPVHGTARWANARDARRMGVVNGLLVVLGRWRRHLLMLPETLSALCIAPPGTGKTAGIVVPTILTGDTVSMVVNDVKPELFAITAGHRAGIGPVIRLAWGVADDPSSATTGACWNPLSPASLPGRGADRDLFVDRLAAILIPDPSGSADPHWSKKGRAALAGFVHFILSKCEAGNSSGLPEVWHGAEPSFAMLLDWMTEASLAAAAEQDRQKREDPSAAFLADPMRDVLMGAVREATDGGYAARAVMELVQLANTPERERGSILSTMDAGLAVFKNAAVRQRTSRSDFAFADLRGRPIRPGGRCCPVTVYVTVSQQDARALGVVTALFVEALSVYLISHPPGAVALDGRRIGPCPVLFVLDEFPQMPRIQALIDGPAVGRGQRLSYLLIGQDFAQIEEKYGKTGLETLLSTTAAKIVLPLNNEAVAKRFSDMVGNRTHEGQSRTRTQGWSKQANPFAVQVNRSLAGIPLIHPSDLMSMRQGSHLLLMQAFANRPLRVETPFYFADPWLRRRAFDPRTGRGPAAPQDGASKVVRVRATDGDAP